ALADQRDRKWSALAPALADARIEHRRFLPRIGPDDQQRVGVLDPGDGWVEDVTGAAVLGIELATGLAAIEVPDAHGIEERLEREHLLDAGKVAGDSADALLPRRRDALGDRHKRRLPGGRLKAAAAADI